MVEERITAIAKEVYDYLKRNCIGTQTTTWEAVNAACPGVLSLDSDDELWAVHAALYHLVSNQHPQITQMGQITQIISEIVKNQRKLRIRSIATAIAPLPIT